VLLILTFVAAMWQVVRAGRREGLDHARLTSLGFWAIAGGIVGSQALMAIVTVELGRAALGHVSMGLLTAVCVLLLLYYRVNFA
jgi:hypothetical protein